MNRLIGRGAEATLYLGKLFDRDVVVKERIRKSYRMSVLDQRIRSYRTIHEAQMIHEAKKAGVSTPIIYLVDQSGCKIFMEYLKGPRLKENLTAISASKRSSICHIVGGSIGKLHKNRLIHGDLTTSNMILSDEETVSFIDFGLSFQSDQTEDRGVDIHLVRRALNSTHFAYAEPCFKSVVDGYEAVVGSELAKIVLSRAREIERRGRYFAERQA
ncbi:Kae1-associated serine/threonine protein kinase [Candidatus Bathyarchaeota archaeon]|nr:Kae1-associated serine/threonine protein kinase [Candidatus Bathyarchaeota archaeon]